ncbi:MAG TPA: hypothetical protein VD903_19205 [Pseudonocardia sp.]|nr:hypothetical protein [Pseudonocardia sp.]
MVGPTVGCDSRNGVRPGEAPMCRSDSYYDAIDSAAATTVRALLVNESVDPRVAADALRRRTQWLDQRYGPGAVRDLAETLAIYAAEALLALAAVQGADPQELLDSWTRDEAHPD